MDKNCEDIKSQQLHCEAVVLNAATIHEGHFVPGPLTGKSRMSELCGLYNERIHNRRITGE